MIFEAYHATDTDNIPNIKNNGFTYKPNKEHWLGNGIYFFIDVSLAKRWAQKTPNAFKHIKHGVVLKVEINVNDSDVIDLRCLEAYDFVKDFFDEYMDLLKEERNLSIHCSDKELSCIIFDKFQKTYDLKCIIADFNERSDSLPKKLKPARDDLWKRLKIQYVETQVCVFDPDCIKYKEELAIKTNRR